MRSNLPARRIIVAEAASATAGSGPRARLVSMVARLPCIARGCAVTTAMKLRCRPGRRHGPSRRAVRLPEGDLPVITGDGTSKSAGSRRFVALSAERLAEWMASDLSKLDLLVTQIDGLHIGNDL